ncbi:putative protein [Arabidopsis thaliana]|uniref:Isoform 2 of Protein OXIDATIVE STRESS 3 LIKE 2 n=1 Tax=Arabidopsis thaliana TaxID=3702 RepID=A0A1I9LQ12-2|nr:uncharacterized protein AT3G43850 [Arabidopsis thaliana]AEE77835.1 hypothetical protein AT3G43850 [Arabidopsis thaliana]CAB83157.1 putative protein [Arabidopsis thaliana]|eukprot:NP_189971.1 hypothetical protein AT3G43850 [Arabidopsis thaliana]
MFTAIDKIDRTFTVDQEFACLSSSTSSDSIGENSDDDEGGENEIESSYNGPLDMMESLEEALPIKRAISKFYKGKSKSFMSLSETSSLPVKDLTKPENLYSRRRRNLLSHRICSRGGISKKPFKSVLAMSQREGDSSSSGDDSLPTLRQHHKTLTPRLRKGSFEAFTFQDKSETDEDHKKATKGATKPVNQTWSSSGHSIKTRQWPRSTIAEARRAGESMASIDKLMAENFLDNVNLDPISIKKSRDPCVPKSSCCLFLNTSLYFLGRTD